MKKILVVEDERDIYELQCRTLEREGFATEVATTVAEAFRKIETPGADYDVILLDMRLPDGDGFTILKRAKALGFSVLVLTAIDDEYTVASYLDLADDYVEKGTKTRILVKRIDNILNRKEDKQAEIVHRDIRIDPMRMIVYKGEKNLFLGGKDYKLLLILMQNIGKPMRREILMRDVWDIDGDFIENNTLSQAIHRLREKIEDDPDDPIIKTVRGGGGYMIEK